MESASRQMVVGSVSFGIAKQEGHSTQPRSWPADWLASEEFLTRSRVWRPMVDSAWDAGHMQLTKTLPHLARTRGPSAYPHPRGPA